jgi:hypothetical protein
MALERSLLALEIERVRRRYVSLLEEAAEAPCAWELLDEGLCWHVVLRDALEPDVDVELLEDAIVVRAMVEGSLRLTLLPVPSPFRPPRPLLHFAAERLEVRLVHGA